MRGDQAPPPAPHPLCKRLGWLVLLWAGSVAALAVIAYALKLVMRAAGLTA